MFKQYSYNIKLKALAVLCLMVIVAGYKRSFGPLLETISEHKQLRQKSLVLKEKSASIQQLQAQLGMIDRILGKGGAESEKVRQGLVNFVAEHGNGTSIFSLKPTHTFQDETYTIYTNCLEVTGSLPKLESLAYNLEKKFVLAKLVSLKYYTIRKNNLPEKLHLILIFQNYENNK